MHKQLLLLGLLRRQEMHGYQLNEFIEQNLDFCTDITKPTAYYLLDKLATDEYITPKEAEEESATRPPRRTYQITETGERYFLELLVQVLKTNEPTTFPVDMAVAFMDVLPPVQIAGIIAARREQVQLEIEQIRNIPDHPGSIMLVIEHHLLHLEAEGRWLDRLEHWITANKK